MLLDSSTAQDDYIEDCEVCCHPIQIDYKFQDQTLSQFSAKSMEEDF